MLISLLLMLEARASSDIENIVTTTDRVYQHAYQPEANADPATNEALRYSRALFQGFRTLNDQPLTTRTLEELCSITKGVDMTVRRTPGTALVNDQTGRIVYTPPEGEAHLRGLLANWETFINTPNDLDPVVRMGYHESRFPYVTHICSRRKKRLCLRPWPTNRWLWRRNDIRLAFSKLFRL